MGPGDLNKAICDLPQMSDPKLVRGLASPDDAGVYKLTDSLAIIQTVDFFTPIVDDPYTFGQIAAANALSDVYAMGGKPLTAMNVVCFPTKSLDISVLKDILRGGVDKILEAGALLVGGHTIDDKELKYGLSVTGTVTAVKAKMADEETAAKVAKCMATLNRKASELMQEIKVHACTDITGFGLIGHVAQLAQNSRVGINIFSTLAPLLPRAEEFAKQGFYPGGSHRNKEFYSPCVKVANEVPSHMQAILFDAQTSGGLLISLAPRKAEVLLNKLRQAGVDDAVIIGEVVSEPRGVVTVE